VSHGIFVGVAAAEACVGEALGLGLAVEPVFATHPASPSATVAASTTTITVDRSRESAMLFIV